MKEQPYLTKKNLPLLYLQPNKFTTLKPDLGPLKFSYKNLTLSPKLDLFNLPVYKTYPEKVEEEEKHEEEEEEEED